jgi:GntR family transcriptional regulator
MPGIDPTGPVAPYLQLAEILRGRIEAGEWRPGERIPTESELVEEFELARSTVRRSIRVLRDAGLVETVPQRGTYVSRRP